MSREVKPGAPALAKPERRALSFATMDEIMPDVERLLTGHVTVGNWSLAMILNHLAVTVRSSVEGFDFWLPWILRRTVGPLAFWWLDRAGRMPGGIKAPAVVAPKPGSDARAEAEVLREAIALFRERGPIAESPAFGPLRPEQWERLHCLHSARHLSFALPFEAGAASPELN